MLNSLETKIFSHPKRFSFEFFTGEENCGTTRSFSLEQQRTILKLTGVRDQVTDQRRSVLYSIFFYFIATGNLKTLFSFLLQSTKTIYL